MSGRGDRRMSASQPVVLRAGPGSGPGGAPTAIALSPILSARYRARDLERIRAAAPGARLVTVSVEGLADGPLDDVEVMLRGWLGPDAFDRLLARAPRLSWVHSATSGVERALTPAARQRGLVVTNARGVFSQPIAEYVLMMILAVSRRLPQLLELQRERTWQPLEGAGAARHHGRRRRPRLDGPGGRDTGGRLRLSGPRRPPSRRGRGWRHVRRRRGDPRAPSRLGSAVRRPCRSSWPNRTSSSSRRRSRPRPRR